MSHNKQDITEDNVYLEVTPLKLVELAKEVCIRLDLTTEAQLPWISAMIPQYIANILLFQKLRKAWLVLRWEITRK